MTKPIGALFFPDFEMLDIYGPLQLFSMHREAFEIVAVGTALGSIFASGGPATVPEAVIEDAQLYDLVIVPGGAGTRGLIHDQNVLDWLRRQAMGGALVTSVCTGAVMLAMAGLLDGRRATTNKRAFEWVADQRPQVLWQRQARWVWDGNFVTASGVSAGMDMALAVIKELLGQQAAADAAEWAEYLANTEADTDPFARSEL